MAAGLRLGLLGLVTAQFEFPIKQTLYNHLYYRSYVQDLCVDIVQSDSKPCSVSQDCSPLLRYDCANYQTSNVSEVMFGETPGLLMTLEGTVQLSSLQSCGEGTCPWCTNHQSCVGPMAETNLQELTAGSCVRWEYSTQNSSEAFEVFVGAFGGTPERLVAYELKRGLAQDWSYGQVQVPNDGEFLLRFYLASYDSSGGGIVGSSLRLRNVRSQPCLNATALAAGPPASTTTSSTSSSSGSTTSSITQTTSSTTASSTVSKSTSSSSSSRSVTSTSSTSTSFTSTSIVSSTSSRTRSTTVTATSTAPVIAAIASTSCDTSDTSELFLVFLSLGAFFLLLLLTALCRSVGENSKAVAPEISKLDRMMQVLRSFGLDDEEDLKLELKRGQEDRAEMEDLRLELERLRAQQKELELLRGAHFTLQHQFMNETRLCAELRRAAAAREVQLIMPDDRSDDEGLLT